MSLRLFQHRPAWARLPRGWALVLCLAMMLSVAVFMIVSRYVYDQFNLPEQVVLRTKLIAVLGLLTLVNLVLMGALAVWMESSARQQSIRIQVQRMLTALNHLDDGVVALDAKHRITGLNVRARAMAAAELRPQMRLGELFPFLDPELQRSLLSGTGTQETEVELVQKGERRVYRFRVFPSKDVRLLFVSEITKELEESERRERQSEMALIGRVAQGVAHDFNNILCAIIGHAELLRLPGINEETTAEALSTICREGERGATLARQLVDLSRPAVGSAGAVEVNEVLNTAAALIGRADASREWDIRCECSTQKGFTSMPAHQLEQMIIRFGLQAMDGYDAPGVLYLLYRADPESDLFGERADNGGTLTIAARPKGDSFDTSELVRDTRPPLARDGGGVIQSVVLSVLEQCGGSLECLRQSNEHPAYRFRLPPPATEGLAPVEEESAMDTEAFRCWAVLLAQPAGARHEGIERARESLLWSITQVNNVVALFDRIKGGAEFQTVLIDERLLGDAREETLQKILRKAPGLPCVVLAAREPVERPSGGLLAAVPAPVSLKALLNALASLKSPVSGHAAAGPEAGRKQ